MEDVPGLLDAMSPRQRESYESAKAAEAAATEEVEEAVEIDHAEPPDLTDAKTYIA